MTPNKHNLRDENETPPIELILKKCWKPDCSRLAVCKDGSGWEWCYEHIDQEKTGSVLHLPAEWYDYDFYLKRILSHFSTSLTEAMEKIGEEEWPEKFENYGNEIRGMEIGKNRERSRVRSILQELLNQTKV